MFIVTTSIDNDGLERRIAFNSDHVETVSPRYHTSGMKRGTENGYCAVVMRSGAAIVVPFNFDEMTKLLEQTA